MTQEEADALAREWIAAWNAHDVEAIVSHYADDIQFASPFVAQLNGGAGSIAGKDAVRAYFARALAAFPDLHFEFRMAFAGVDSLVIYYLSVRDLLAAEVFTLGVDGKFIRVQCHYRPSKD